MNALILQVPDWTAICFINLCALQIPSLLDLSVDDVSGTCTDTILVVSPELSQAVTCSTMQAGKRPRAAMQDSSVPHGSEQFTVKQVTAQIHDFCLDFGKI